MIALVLLLLFQTAFAPAAGISGRVIDAGAPSLQPLFHARVEIRLDSGSPTVVRTDEYGQFEFPNLRPGKYGLSVIDDGFIRKTVTVTVAAGQQRNDVTIGLDVSPTLYGHIYDPHNIPAPNVLVEAIKVIYGPRGDRSVVTVETALSDDRGEYHLYWLDPGEYYIRASSGPTYAPTYFPGFRDPKEATSIRLRVGSNLSGFDFKLQPITVAVLGGHISIEATNESVGTTITATPAGAGASIQKFQGKSFGPPLGEYTISGIVPNTYIVSAQYTVGGEQQSVHRKFTLKGLERSFILKLSPGSLVDGSSILDSGAAMNLRSVRAMLDSVDPDLPSSQSASLDASGQFAVSRVEPGDYDVRILDLPGDLYVKSAQSGDDDILSKSLHIDYVSPPPIRVILGTDGSRLDGVVVDSANRAIPEAQVVLVPDLARRNSPTQFRTATSEEGGRFTLRGIPPGEYKLFAWQSIEPNAYMNPNYLLGYENLGLPLTIAPGSNTSTSVRLIPTD